MTQEEQLEFDKCANDIVYFINKYLLVPKPYVTAPDFKLYPFQEALLKELEDSESVILNQSMQMGVTTLLAGRALHKIVFTDNYSVIMVYPKVIQGMRTINSIRDSYYALPEYFKPGTEELNKKKIKLKNGSSVTLISSSPGGVCGKSADEVLVDGAAFMDDFKEVCPAIAASLKPGGKYVVSSSNYRGGYFAELCKIAASGHSNWNYIELRYNLHPKRNRLWRLNQDYVLGANAAKVECDCEYYYDSETKSIKSIFED